jgi:hypothetical protein
MNKKEHLIKLFEQAEQEATKLYQFSSDPGFQKSVDTTVSALKGFKEAIMAERIPFPSSDGYEYGTLGIGKGLGEHWGHRKEEYRLLDLGHEIDRYYREEYWPWFVENHSKPS